jgi:hypothetical protein
LIVTLVEEGDSGEAAYYDAVVSLGGLKEQNQQRGDNRPDHKGHQAAAQHTHRLAQATIDGGLHTQHRTCGDHNNQ